MTAELEPTRVALETMLGCPVALTTEPRIFFREFEQTHCFNAALQPAFTAAYLADFATRADRRIVHELKDPLELSLTLVWLHDALAVIGPYTGQAAQPGDAEALLGRLKISGSHLPAYRLYRARFAIVDSEYVMRGAVALVQADGGDAAGIGFERVTAAGGPVTPGADEPPHSAPYAAIDARYAIEQEFMQAVTDGSERRALAALHRMEGIPAPPNYLNTPFLGVTILRIMSRVAAQKGGLPPVAIDAISQTYAQRLHRSGHTPDPTRAMQDAVAMVAEFCRQVRRHRQRPYSRLVRQVMDEIELHLSHAVATSELALRLHVSESHLARQFKAETGHTISEHLAAERAARAAHLLATTDQPVRDIAAYVGYLDANYFVKVFRSVYRVTPTQYRRQHSV